MNVGSIQQRVWQRIQCLGFCVGVLVLWVVSQTINDRSMG